MKSKHDAFSTHRSLLPWLRGAGYGLALLLSLSSLACTSEKEDPVTSSQTHWLKQCTSSSQCGDLECQCGVCTAPCDDEGACAEFGEDASCTPTSGISSCGSGAAELVCFQACSDSECGNNSECVDGVCVPTNDDAADDDDADDSSDDAASDDGSDDDADDGSDDAASDDGSDDAASDDSSDDSSDDGGVSDGPPGVDCASYVNCDALAPCESGSNCIAFSECGGALCIEAEEACELSCPDPNDCAIAESYPEQLFCDGKVPAHPAGAAADDDAPAEDDAPGDDDEPAADHLVCDDYPRCAPEQGCEEGAECIEVGCGGAPICISWEQACELICGTPSCLSLDSFPPQVGCEGERIDVIPFGDTPVSDGDDAANDDAANDDGASDDAANDDAASDDAASDDAASDDAASDDAASDDAASDDGPVGVPCADYPSCGVNGSGCEAGTECIAIAGCSGAICIESAEACELSCPAAEECLLLESFPVQLGCDGLVMGHDDGASDDGASDDGAGAEISLDDLNSECVNDGCPEGLTPVHFFGIAGPSGPEFCNCSIPCAGDASICPEGSTCQTIADGPGEVCVKD